MTQPDQHHSYTPQQRVLDLVKLVWDGLSNEQIRRLMDAQPDGLPWALDEMGHTYTPASLKVAAAEVLNEARQALDSK